jgi:putative flippase GtrA
MTFEAQLIEALRIRSRNADEQPIGNSEAPALTTLRTHRWKVRGGSVLFLYSLRVRLSWLLQSSLCRFVLVGLSNTLIGLGTIYVCWHALGWPDIGANMAGYGVGFAWSFVLHRSWTFRSRASIGHSVTSYAAVCAASWGANLAMLGFLRQALGPESFLPHVMGVATYSVLVYCACRWIVFNPSDRGNDSLERHDGS